MRVGRGSSGGRGRGHLSRGRSGRGRHIDDGDARRAIILSHRRVQDCRGGRLRAYILHSILTLLIDSEADDAANEKENTHANANPSDQGQGTDLLH